MTPASPTTAVPIKPVLRWAGSKKRSASEIVSKFNYPYKRYVELFAGSACLFFHLQPTAAILVDNNVPLMAFYRSLAAEPERIHQAFSQIPRTPQRYYEVRELFHEPIDDPILFSAYFLFLNRNCFNGIFRTNLAGHFNVPFSASRVATYPTLEDLRAASAALRRASIIGSDFEKATINHVDAGDLVYLDPPYYVTSSRVFREYSAYPFDRGDFHRLSALLDEIDRRGAQFVMSYPECDIAAPLAERWNSTIIQVRRTVAGKLSSRGYANEYLISNRAI